ncbi:helix-turn-helix domain-containing protein [Desulfosarcina sp. OttesenSCG-928-B08]|nr:helix-turn-helix domain-containing protein [Desulfosarcina sp. OttesenSCG-928-B08]
MELLKAKVAELGQAPVARKLGYSPSAINQVLKGTYGGGLENLMRRVAETFGDQTVFCPVMGEIPLQRCAEERKKPFSATSPQRVRLFQACQDCNL